MKVLLCHSHYQQPGGEDQIFVDEACLLESRGHQVIRFLLHNDSIDEMNRWDVAWKTLWNRKACAQLRELIRRKRPDIMHCVNTFPLISPAAYYVARDEKVPVVQSLQNYRLVCPAATLFRDGRICHDCVGKRIPWPGVLHGCYRESRAASAVVASMLTLHRAIRSWARMVDTYIVPTNSARQIFIAGGLPPHKLVVRPNFVHPDPKAGSGSGGYAVFVGRLAPEKGLPTLLAAWTHLNGQLPLKILGDGPLADDVRTIAAQQRTVQWLGRKSTAEVLSIVGDALFLVIPSTWYEVLPKVIIEAYSKGTPVIASRIGGMAEVIADGRTGLHFEAGDPQDLASKIRTLLADPEQLASMRLAARDEYERKYAAEPSYRQLACIYRRTLERNRSGPNSASRDRRIPE